ncbi:MAG: ABC transporter ATP-binding protein [Rhodoferax sp.]|jgi:putative ABC transport system ATP-binding protein|nr:ABC transporter ATP-binding protein [Rhodoferax sp.]
MAASILEIAQLRFAWPGSGEPCLDIDALHVNKGESVFLFGPSGCGKSTLLALIAGVLLPQHGQVRLDGRAWAGMPASRRDRYRVDHVGYIFQQFNLLPYLSVRDNVLAPCRFSPLRRQAAQQQAGSDTAAAAHWLEGMGLPKTLWDRPARDLSVGQQQRVAAARALIGQPALVIADEPTSALDEQRRNGFLDLLLAACEVANSALVFVSHDLRMADRFSRAIELPRINRVPLHEESTP